MHGRISKWGICALAVALAAAAADLRAQDGRGPALNQAAAGTASPSPAGSQLQLAADNQPASGSNVPPDRPPPPTAEDVANADLAKRVSDLEKALADYAKAAAATPAAAAPAAPTKPLIAPSGRIQMDAANYTQNAASDAQIGNIPNAVGFRRARLALLGEYEVVDYIIEMDFANRGVASVINQKDESVGFKDVYIQVRDLPLLGVVRVGHF